MSNIEKTRRELAKRAIKIKKEIEALMAEQDGILAQGMETSGGESFTVNVPGKGRVQFVRATEGGVPQGTFAPVFDVKAFNALSEQRKRALAKDKVVVMKEKVSSSRKESLRVTFNA